MNRNNVNNFPENCNVCPFTNRCLSAFGNLGCHFKKEIEKSGKKKK